MADQSSSGTHDHGAPSSPLRDLAEAAAREASALAGRLEQLYRDAFVDTATSGPVEGLRRGTVVEAVDPLQRHRVMVVVPALGEQAVWAERPLGPDGATPADLTVGARVWLAFEDGDRALPVVVGQVAG
jgi:hypothetical protein